MENTKKLKNRIDFIYLFDVKDGNPNGDPDKGNEPRMDMVSGQGLVSDVCLKRKIRNYVQIREQADEQRNRIYVRSKDISGKECFLNDLVDEAYDAIGVDLNQLAEQNPDTKKKVRVKNEDTVNMARAYMCDHYFDIRTFGAVMSTGSNAGQVRGPVQMTFARSIDQITPVRNAITVCAARKKASEGKDFEDQTGIQGCKYTVPYGLYMCNGFISPRLAQQTGFDTDDLALMWDALKNMFDEDHSASRGLMTPRAIIAFKHDGFMGNALSGELFDLVSISKKESVENPRCFDDYEIRIAEDKLPQGVTIERIL